MDGEEALEESMKLFLYGLLAIVFLITLPLFLPLMAIGFIAKKALNKLGIDI